LKNIKNEFKLYAKTDLFKTDIATLKFKYIC